jgi:hypothetical protein
MSRSARLADFEQRVADDPSSVYELGDRGRFVTVHPMSDEQSLLDQLALPPQSCIAVDLYWQLGDDVVFVQFSSSSYPSPRPVGTYVRCGAGGYLNVVIVVPDQSISSVRVIGELTAIATAIATLDRRALGDKLVAFARE